MISHDFEEHLIYVLVVIAFYAATVLFAWAAWIWLPSDSLRLVGALVIGQTVVVSAISLWESVSNWARRLA